MLQDHDGADLWSTQETSFGDNTATVPKRQISADMAAGHHSKFRHFVIACAKSQMLADDQDIDEDTILAADDQLELDFSEMQSFANQIAYWSGATLEEIKRSGATFNIDDVIAHQSEANSRMALFDRYLTTIESTLDQEGTLDDAEIEEAEDNVQKVIEILQGILQRHNSDKGVVDLNALRAEQGLWKHPSPPPFFF